MFYQLYTISSKSLKFSVSTCAFIYILAYTGLFRGERADPGAPKTPLLIQEGRCVSAGGGYPPPPAGSSLPTISLAHGQDMLSMGKLVNFLPAGKNFAIPAFDFLPVGNGRRSSTEKMTKHHEGRRHRHYRGYGRCTAKWRVLSANSHGRTGGQPEAVL